MKITSLNDKLTRRKNNAAIASDKSGAQKTIDLVSYSSLEEQKDYLVVDGRYTRTLYISGYPLVASSGWLNNLINFNGNIDISHHIQQVDAAIALPQLSRKITELESTRRALIKSGKIVGPEVTDPLESAQDLRDKIQRGQEMLFQFSAYISLSGETLHELDKQTKILESTLAARMFFSKVARYQQIEGLQSVLPRCEDLLKQQRNLDSSSAALTFPLLSSELVHEDGILYGVNKSNNSLVILDRFQLNNANSIVFAQSGAGKSYSTKVEIIRQMMKGTSVIVIDPEREYELLTKSVGGTYVKLATNSDQKINPFDQTANSLKSRDLSENIQDLAEIVSLMVGGLNAKDEASLDRALMAMYNNPKKRELLLVDLYNKLQDLNQHKLCERLDRYITGSLANIFNSPTNIDLNNQLVVFDIKDMPESMRQLMMLIVSNYVQNEVKASPKKRLLIIDEGWMLLEHEESARFIAGLVRRARKYYLGVSIISQQANDFLNNKYGKAVASQSALRILMRQDSTTIDNVVQQFGLSEYERNFLLTCDNGEALVIADQNHAALKVVASKQEHPLITTSPKEMYTDA